VPLNLEYIFIINIFMAILVTMLCDHADDHGGRRRPTAALWPHSRRHTALRNHTKKQVNVVKSRKKHCYLYYYDHYGHSASCLPSRYLAKDVKIGPHNDDLYWAHWHRPQSGCQEGASSFGAVEMNYSTSDDDWSTGVLINRCCNC